MFLILLLMVTSSSFANWSVPQEVVTGTWGKGPGQFYYHRGETTDSFPQEFGVDKNGIIVIPDGPNKRIMLYNPDGTVKATLSKPVQLPDLDSSWGWPLGGFHLFSGGNSFIVDCNYQKMVADEEP